MIWSGEYDSQVRVSSHSSKEKGFDGIEIPLFSSRRLQTQPRSEEILEALGLECNVTSAFLPGLSPISDDASIRARAIAP